MIYDDNDLETLNNSDESWCFISDDNIHAHTA